MQNEAARQDNPIGIITVYHENYNFGGLLQAYALPLALEKYLDFSAEQIDYFYKSESNHTPKEKLSVSRFFYKSVIAFFNALEKRNFIKRKKAFKKFMDNIPHSACVYDCDTISKSVEHYTAFICGGDQIWSDCRQTNWFGLWDLKAFTLRFVPEPVKKISYAPSMATLELTDAFKDEFKVGLNRLDSISVREKTAIPVLETLTDKPVHVVVDPVLLLQESDWMEAANYPLKEEKYILCYLLGDSIEERKAVKKFAKTVNCKIVTFPHILQTSVRKSDLFFGDMRDYSSGPREFLGLIKNAEAVVTDSFHACVFSMIFKTPFIIFERGKIAGKADISSRMHDFLEEYRLDNQLVAEEELTAMTEIPEIDFTYAHEHWKTRREASLEYLKNALNND